jgi:hypothetical protein
LFQQLTEEEVAADGVNASAMQKGLDYELDKPQESTFNAASAWR